MLKFHLLAIEILLLPISVFNSDLLECIIVSFVVLQLLIVIVDDLVAGHIQELAGMRHDDHSVLAGGNVVLQPHHGIQI